MNKIKKLEVSELKEICGGCYVADQLPDPGTKIDRIPAEVRERLGGIPLPERVCDNKG